MYGLIGMRESLTGKEGGQQSDAVPTVPTQSAVTGQTGGQEGGAGGHVRDPGHPFRDAIHNVQDGLRNAAHHVQDELERATHRQ
jgi:hypothetical protein